MSALIGGHQDHRTSHRMQAELRREDFVWRDVTCDRNSQVEQSVQRRSPGANPGWAELLACTVSHQALDASAVPPVCSEGRAHQPHPHLMLPLAKPFVAGITEPGVPRERRSFARTCCARLECSGSISLDCLRSAAQLSPAILPHDGARSSMHSMLQGVLDQQ